MPYDLSQILVVGVSSRALFDLRTEDRLFDEEGLEAYSKYQIAHEDEPLLPGPAFALVRALLHLNAMDSTARHSEVVVMSRNNADTSLRIFNSIREHRLDITRGAMTSGASLARYAKAFEVDLFLSAHAEDVQMAVDGGFAAARIYPSPPDHLLPTDQVRIAFDGDAVLFSEESELINQAEGLAAFHEHEQQNASEPLAAGPFASFLKRLSALQRRFGRNEKEEGPIRTALITARNSPAHERVIRTLRSWDVRVDETFLLGGAAKDGVVRAFGPHIFFDDQARHLEPSAGHTAVAQVPFRSSATEQLVLEGLPAPLDAPPPQPRRRSTRKPKGSADVAPPTVFPPSATVPSQRTRGARRKKS